MRQQLHISIVNELIPKVAAIGNRDGRDKPEFGFWTSSYINGSTDWLRWCQEESWCEPTEQNWFLLGVKRGARICHIDSLDDLVELLARYPSGHSSWSLGPVLDFERLATDFDGLHLTENGLWATRMTAPNLYMWDAESTLWFRWCFSKVKKIREAREKR